MGKNSRNVYFSNKRQFKAKKTLVIDTVGYNKKGREDLRKLAHKYDTQTYIIYVKPPLDLVKQRWVKNKQTNERHNVDKKELDDIVNNFDVPTQEEYVIIVTPDMKPEEILGLLKL